MSSPTFNFGNFGGARSGVQVGLGLIESLIDANANAQRQFLSELRRRLSGHPILNATIDYAEALAMQQRDFGHTVIHHVERSLSSAVNPGSTRNDEQNFSRQPPPSQPSSPAHSERDQAPSRSEPLRLRVPVGKRSIAVPLHLRNHRDVTDIVSFSIVTPAISGVPILPSDLVRFVPEALAVPPKAEAAGNLLVRISPDLLPFTEYWSEIVLAGEETKRIPLVLEITTAEASSSG